MKRKQLLSLHKNQLFIFPVVSNSFPSIYNSFRIQVFDSTGDYLFKFGTNGNHNGQFNSPSAVAVNSRDEMIVADHLNHRIQVFDPKGNFVSVTTLYWK